MGVKHGSPSTEDRIQYEGIWEYGTKANILNKFGGNEKSLE